MTPKKHELTVEYETKLDLYRRYADAVHDDLSDLLVSSRLHIHSIDVRLKEPSSVNAKIVKKNKYHSLNEITDLVGIRVICYFKSEIPYLCRLISSTFTIDEDNSIDHTQMPANQFGYRSVHYVVRGASKACTNTEFDGMHTEIQVRTLLEHAWAEVEHGLGYKSSSSIPDKLKRSIHRLSGLFELADEEFVRIRHALVESKRKIIPPHLENPAWPLDAETLTTESLIKFVATSNIVMQIDLAIAKQSNTLLHVNEEAVIECVARLERICITDTEQLERLLRERATDILSLYEQHHARSTEYVGAHPENHGNESSPRGICITYLCMLISEQPGAIRTETT